MIPAYINHGRWVVDCPHCPNASLAEQTFTCSDCGTRGNITYPPEAAEIERILSVRLKAHRNWWPGETVADLIRENTSHGMDST